MAAIPQAAAIPTMFHFFMILLRVMEEPVGFSLSHMVLDSSHLPGGNAEGNSCLTQTNRTVIMSVARRNDRLASVVPAKTHAFKIIS
jgi:hypothetical protein